MEGREASHVAVAVMLSSAVYFCLFRMMSCIVWTSQTDSSAGMHRSAGGRSHVHPSALAAPLLAVCHQARQSIFSLQTHMRKGILIGSQLEAKALPNF